jgi:hypothetical protein
MALLAAAGRGGWEGQRAECLGALTPPKCFCERARSGLVAQPANTASNLGFVAVGLAIAAVVDRDRRRRAAGRAPERPNPMTRDAFLPGAYAVVVALLGPGSMALHASLTRWGGKLDVASMYVFAAFLVAYGVMQAAGWGRARFFALYAALTAALVASKLWTPIESDWIFGATLSAAALSDGATRRARPALRRDARWALASLVLFATAFAVWLPSQSGGLLCDPESLLQGHAVWHLLCALAAGALFLYLRSEHSDGVTGTR